jgi:hypothetical protein
MSNPKYKIIMNKVPLKWGNSGTIYVNVLSTGVF